MREYFELKSELSNIDSPTNYFFTVSYLKDCFHIYTRRNRLFLPCFHSIAKTMLTAYRHMCRDLVYHLSRSSINDVDFLKFRKETAHRFRIKLAFVQIIIIKIETL